jgi:hypothetical protein
MNRRKNIKLGEKVGLKLTAADRKILLDDLVALDTKYAQAIRDTPTNQPVQFTLDEWEDFGGYVAAEANHADDKKLGKKLDTIFSKVQKILDTYTDEGPVTAGTIEDAQKAKVLSDHAAQIAEWTARALVAAETLGIKHKPLEHFQISSAQRDVLLLAPTLAEEIKGKLAKKRASFTLAEVASMTMALAEKLPGSEDRKQVAVLLVVEHLMERLQEAFGPPSPAEGKSTARKPKASPSTLYQFKVTLKRIEPPIWRRIQVKDCTLDKLHEHIQTAMGWTNSHLHHFRIDEQLYGDPMLMQDNFNELGYKDSTTTKVSDILPETGKRFQFEYEYDFGDSWEHEILFEGRLRVEKGTRYPLCLEGARACPPEDVGGAYGYQEYLEALVDPNHERHEEFMEWGGRFKSEKFDTEAASKRMRRGLPNWREMR